MGKLNSLSVQRMNKPGLYGDGGGLYLQVSDAGTKSWIFRFMLNKRSRSMGLGSTEIVTLAEARMKAIDCRRQLFDGIDPIEARAEKKSQKKVDLAKAMTFSQCAAAYIEAHRPSWKNAKHAAQWVSTLETYAAPVIGGLPVQSVDTGLVMKAVEPIWRTKTETASRLRNRIELVLSWATVRGYRKGDNPARWQGHLDQLLPKRGDVQKVVHFAALPFSELGDFMAKLRTLEGIAPLGLEFQILTAARTGEVMGARWEEINLTEGVWTIPAERMKAKREHRVPLSPRALEILKQVQIQGRGDFVFPGRRPTKTLSNNAFLALLKKRMGLEVTAHGFRSTFRDWAAERTVYTRDVVEMALAHAIQDATEAAYRRGDLLMKRQVLMNDWARFCEIRSKPGSVLAIQSRNA